jgi:hypothetical protein
MDDRAYYAKLGLSEQYQVFNQRLAYLAESGFLNSETRREALLADLIHMHLNRLFIDDQRKHELVVYYYLLKIKLTLKAMKRY